MRPFFLIAFLGLVAILLPLHSARAAYCEGASHMGCYEGVDPSGRTPGAMYDAAVEGLKEARTQAERALAQKAMRDAFNPRMSNPRAIECYQNPGPNRDFAACVQGKALLPG